MPEQSDRDPSIGLNFASGARRSVPASRTAQGASDVPKSLKIVAALVVVCASAAIGWFGVKWWQGTQQTAAPPPPADSPAPTTTPIATVRLTFDLDAVNSAAGAVLMVPSCGDEWVGAPNDANGVELVASADIRDAEDGPGQELVLSSTFTADDGPLAFLANEGDYIVTRDGVVVSPDWGAEFVPMYVVADGTGTSSGTEVILTGATLCDVADGLSEIWAEVDFSTATPEEIAAAQAKADAFNAEHATLPPGEYRIYATAPIIVGESAAIARALSEEGVENVGTLAYSIGETPLAADERLTPYCTDVVDAAGEPIARDCDVPTDVLQEVLTRDVPQAYVVAGQPALAVSQPIVIEVD